MLINLLISDQKHGKAKTSDKSSSSAKGRDKDGNDWFGKAWFEEALQPQNRGTFVGVALAAAAGYMLMMSSGNNRQISWQEFRINYLEKGEVNLVTSILCMHIHVLTNVFELLKCSVEDDT